MNRCAEKSCRSSNAGTCDGGIVGVDGSARPISVRFDKNVVTQIKPNADEKIAYSHRLSGVRKNAVANEMRLLRLNERNVATQEMEEVTESSDTFESQDGSCLIISKRGEINEDWGRRTELHNIFNVNDGDRVWNIIRRGLFCEIKLWKNSYGNINCKATGKISVKGIPEKSIIEINTEDNLRKLLNLSHMQWSAVCDAMCDKDMSLSFNAFQEFDINKSSSLDKLWFFICKRRHFLPNVCVMGKLSGAVKLMKELQVMPKIVVTHVRDVKGHEII